MSGVKRPSSNACAQSHGQPDALRLAADRAPGEVLLHRARRRVVRRVGRRGSPTRRAAAGRRPRSRSTCPPRARSCAVRADQVGLDQAHAERELHHLVRHERVEGDVRRVAGLERAERDAVRVDRRIGRPHLAEVRVQAALRIPGQSDPLAVDVEVGMRRERPAADPERPGGHVEEVAHLRRPGDAHLPARVSVTAGGVDQRHVAVLGEGARVLGVVGVVLGRAAAVEDLEEREAAGRRLPVGQVHVGVERDGRAERVRRRHRNAVGVDRDRRFRLRRDDGDHDQNQHPPEHALHRAALPSAA